MKGLSKLYLSLALLVGVATMYSCNKSTGESSATGWSHNDPKWGGFEVPEEKEQQTGPGLTLVPGGTFVMGNTEQDVMIEYHSIPRRSTVSSFYMDQHEVSNVNYREYTYWMSRIFGDTYPELVQKSIPDTLVWLDELAYNEPFVQNYFRYPSYNNYPVVGVSWLQPNEYCKWRSDRVNEMLLITEGVLDHDPNQYGQENFNTEAYLLGQYEGVVKDGIKNLDPNGPETRRARFEDGLMLPDYRLPTEAEWEFAAKQGLLRIGRWQEWCSDYFAPYAQEEFHPRGFRSVRTYQFGRPTTRIGVLPTASKGDLGFRCARNLGKE